MTTVHMDPDSAVERMLVQFPTTRINYNDLERVDSVTTMDFAGVPLKIVGHRDIPKDEMHAVLHGQCVGKIINIE